MWWYEDFRGNDWTIVGKIAGFEEDSIFQFEEFDESALLANIVVYAMISTENKELGANIREIGNDDVDHFIGNGENIFFIGPLVDQDRFHR